MLRYCFFVAAAAASASLFGCGAPAAPTPAPGYVPTTVAEAWANHLNAFVAGDLNKIMFDYDRDSVLQVYNDGCSPGALHEYVGDSQIRRFFLDLFAQLTEAPVTLPAFHLAVNPTVDDAAIGGSFDAANVFLVWEAPDRNINKSTNTFLWKEVGPLPGYVTAIVKIKKQNIVLTEECPPSPAPSPEAPTYDVNSTIAVAWDNHLTAFGAQDLAKILLDYTESSTVQVFTWDMAEGQGYASFAGLTAIGGMFTQLWEDMNAQQVGGSTGLAIPDGFPRVEVDLKSVFLVWSSYSHPKATETFLFDDEGNILRQTIVVTTGTAPGTVRAVEISV